MDEAGPELSKHRRYYARHRERLLAKRRTYRQTHAAQIHKYQSDHREQMRVWSKRKYAKHRLRIRANAMTDTSHAKHLNRLYGAGAADHYAIQLEKQAGKCAGCGGPSKRRLSLDHDHATGRRRGALCDHCNTVLGRCNDSPDLLRRLADYLESWASIGPIAA